MSKKEEILHKLTTEDRNYIKEKFKEKDRQITDLETKLAENENELQKYKIEELADACADLGMPKLSKAQLWKSIEDHHTRNMVIEKQLEIADKENNELKHQLEEKEKQVIAFAKEIAVLNRNVEAYKTLAVDLFNSKNKKTIEELEKARKYVDGRTYLAQYLDERVKQLKENRNV